MGPVLVVVARSNPDLKWEFLVQDRLLAKGWAVSENPVFGT